MESIDIMLEVTRRCNLKCSHCLRGDSERKDLDPKVLAATVRLIGTLNSYDIWPDITLTGGEPFLKPDIMDEFIFSVKSRRELAYTSIGIITNGIITNGITPGVTKLESMLERWAAYGDIHIHISNDAYHRDTAWPKQINSTWYKYKDKFEFICSDQFISLRGVKPEYVPVFARGRAANWGYKMDDYTSPVIYITVDGGIFFDSCNYPYEYIDAHLSGNILAEEGQQNIEAYILDHLEQTEEENG